MESKNFSLDDVVVLKENDKLPNDQLTKIVGGGDCTCNCRGNSAPLAKASLEEG